MEPNKFPAKVLLFGEYTVISGGSALAVPFWRFSGQWQYNKAGRSLADFYVYLKTLKGADVPAIEAAITKNQTYESSIPLGSGIGSSGSLTAAAYSTFFVAKERSIKETQAVLSTIESFFHGKSSGMDPLTCFYQKPVLIKNGVINLLDDLELPHQLKLLNSQKSRVSKPLIEHFKIRMDDDENYEEKIVALSKLNDRIIGELIEGKDISTSFKEISVMQYELFLRMIPVKLRDMWQKGLETDQYYMKLSGAGGGGYFLVYEEVEGSLEGLISIGD